MERYKSLLQYLVDVFESLNIPYLVTGSVASIAYGEPRFTNDIDVVAEIREDQIPKLKRFFPEGEFYLDEGAARWAIENKSQFNIIHPASGLKVDIIIKQDNPFDNSRFSRIKKLYPLENVAANFASPEDVIIKKMVYYKEGGSEKHLRDITGILRISPELVDKDYILRWAEKLNLVDIWDAVLNRIKA